MYANLQVSVSEFMSLVKVLQGKTGSSAPVRATIGRSGRKQAYKLLRCVDKHGDRRVALRDLVVFVFATWTEELNQLSGAKGGAEDLRQRRRQLQKVQRAVSMGVNHCSAGFPGSRGPSPKEVDKKKFQWGRSPSTTPQGCYGRIRR